MLGSGYVRSRADCSGTKCPAPRKEGRRPLAPRAPCAAGPAWPEAMLATHKARRPAPGAFRCTSQAPPSAVARGTVRSCRAVHPLTAQGLHEQCVMRCVGRPGSRDPTQGSAGERGPDLQRHDLPGQLGQARRLALRQRLHARTRHAVSTGAGWAQGANSAAAVQAETQSAHAQAVARPSHRARQQQQQARPPRTDTQRSRLQGIGAAGSAPQAPQAAAPGAPQSSPSGWPAARAAARPPRPARPRWSSGRCCCWARPRRRPRPPRRPRPSRRSCCGPTRGA